MAQKCSDKEEERVRCYVRWIKRLRLFESSFSARSSNNLHRYMNTEFSDMHLMCVVQLRFVKICLSTNTHPTPPKLVKYLSSTICNTAFFLTTWIFWKFPRPYNTLKHKNFHSIIIHTDVLMSEIRIFVKCISPISVLL